MSVYHGNILKIKTLTAMACLALGLAACGDNGQFGFPSQSDDADISANASDTAPTRTVERDVEAPDVFQVEEPGLWDGRPSLGGVWVAHPSAVDPERVIIRNTSNGKFVVGALFRRERDNPGPALQISSDAAQALGVVAGSPANLNVTALRRAETPVEATATATTNFDEPTGVSAAPLDPIAGAAAAIAAADTAPAPKPAPKPATSSLAKPFIQIGFFSIETNARSTASKMRAANLDVTVIAQTVKGRDFWRVLVGPAQTKQALNADLATVKGLGFTDAYAVTN